MSVDDIKCDEFLVFQSYEKITQQISINCCKDVDACLVLLPFLQGSIVVWTVFLWELGWKREDVDIRSKEVDKNVELYVPKVILSLLKYLIEDLFNKCGASFLQ